MPSGPGPAYPYGINPNMPGAAPKIAAAKKAANKRLATSVTNSIGAPNAPKVKTKVAPKTGNRNSAFNKWLQSTVKTAAPSMSVNPLDGMPQDTVLGAYPGLGDIPDGSNVVDAKSPKFTQGKASLIDPVQYAKLEGRQSYSPVIQALMLEKQRLEGGKSQAFGMIDKSYGDAAAQDQQGADRIGAGTTTANQGLTDLAARMAQAAGGDPTAAAAIGSTTADAQGANTKFAQIAQGTQADSAAAAARDASTAKIAYSSANDNRQTDLADKIGAAKTEGEQAQGKAIMEALGFNDSMKTSQLGRDQSKQSAWLSAALAGPEITRANLANEQTRQGLKLNVHNSEVNDWTNIASSKRADYQAKWTKYLGKVQAGQIVDAFKKGNTPAVEMAIADPQARQAVAQDVLGPMMRDGSPIMPPAKMFKAIQTQLRSGYGSSSNKARAQLAKQFMQQVLPQWEDDHPNATHKWVMGKNGTPTLVKR